MTNQADRELSDACIKWHLRHIEPHLKDADAAVDTLVRGVRKAIAAARRQGQRCTCPSGDGSLRWPCPSHPPEVPDHYNDGTGRDRDYRTAPTPEPQGGGDVVSPGSACQYRHKSLPGADGDRVWLPWQQFGHETEIRHPAAPPSAPVGVEAPTLPVEIYGAMYDVPIRVQLHIEDLRMSLEAIGQTKGSHPVLTLIDAVEHCLSAADEGVDYGIGRPMLDAMTTLGLLEKVGRGKWAPTKAAQRFVTLARTAPPSAPVGVEGLPPPFGYIEPRQDLSGYEVFDDPGPRRAAIWNLHGMQQALAQQPAAVDEAAVDRVAKAIADVVGHGMTEKCEAQARAAIAALAHQPAAVDGGVRGLVAKWREEVGSREGGPTAASVHECADELEAALAQQPAACRTCGEAIRPDAMTGTTCRCAQQPAAEAHCATCSCVPGMTPAVRFNTTPAEREGAVRDHLVRMGWTPPAEAQAQAQGVVDRAMVERVLHTRVPGGSEVWHWIEGGGVEVAPAHRRIAEVVIKAYIEQTTGKPIHRQDHEAALTGERNG